MKKQVLVVGGGGHSKSIIDSLINQEEIEIIGILDKFERLGENVLGIPIIGTDEDLENYYKQGIRHIVLGIGSVGIPVARYNLYKKIKALGYSFPTIIDRTAIVSRYVTLGEGVYIGKGVILNAGVIVGSHSIINTGSTIEHDCMIEEFVHIAPKVTVCGGVKIEGMTHIGAGSTILQQLAIGSHTIVGAGSVVTHVISSGVKAYGNPCREVNESE